MKTIIKITGVMLFLTVFTLTSQAQFNGELFEKNIPAPSLSNNMFNEPSSQNIFIYLPPSYHEVDYSFPVLYFLWGWGGGANAEYIISGYETGQTEDDLEEFIVVIFEGCNLLRGSFYVNSPAIGNWEDFVIKDLTNYMDSHYRTIRKSQCRGIAGHSMGGYGAFNMTLKFPDIFSSYYGGSPAFYTNSDLTESGIFGFDVHDKIKVSIDYLESLMADNLESELGNLNSTFLDQPDYVQTSLSYGAAFAPDTGGHVPFLSFPYSLNDNQLPIVNDSIMSMWYNGLGNWDKKIQLSYNNLLSCDTLIFSYGDEEIELGRGVRFLLSILDRYDIENTIFEYEGGHGEGTRFFTQMFPAMSITLWRDSSRFKTGTEILAFEVDNPVQETVIDTEKGTVEAFVSDTSSLEAISPQIILSDGAWETPLARQELDFSWGPIVFKVTSGDGQSMKLWTVSVTQVSTSKLDNVELPAFSVFPNPASDYLYINNSIPQEGIKFQIFNLMGTTVCDIQKLYSNKIKIESLTKGIYFIKLSGQNINYLQKFIKN